MKYFITIFIIEVITGGGYSHIVFSNIIMSNMGIFRSTWYAFFLSDSGTGYKNNSFTLSLEDGVEEGYTLLHNFVGSIFPP